MTTKGKVLGWITVIVILLLSGYVGIKFWYVYAEGVNEGDINYFQKEGYIFKTYEGKMILRGFKAPQGGGLQSNELKFSVENPNVARQIEEGSNIGVKLHWKRYLGVLPWRGNSQYVVDSVYAIPAGNNKQEQEIPFTVELPITE